MYGLSKKQMREISQIPVSFTPEEIENQQQTRSSSIAFLEYYSDRVKDWKNDELYFAKNSFKG